MKRSACVVYHTGIKEVFSSLLKQLETIEGNYRITIKKRDSESCIFVIEWDD